MLRLWRLWLVALMRAIHLPDQRRPRFLALLPLRRRVFVSVFGAKDQFEKTVKALNHARGRLRSLVGKNCGLRHAPDLHFAEDRTLERGARVEELLRSIPKPPGEPEDSGAPGAS